MKRSENDLLKTIHGGAFGMTSSTWDPADDGGWALSNGNLTATSPDNDTKGNIFVCYGSPAIPTNAKAYFEFTVTGAAVQTAFSVGFGVHGANVSNKNLTAEGETVPYSQFVAFSYNLGISNNGDVIYDPQHNATRTAAQGPAPNQWPNGSVIGVLLDRVADTVEFTLNGVVQGGAFDISGIGNQAIYPMTFSWFKSGPVAVINGGTNGFAETIPTGFTALDNLTGTVTAPSPPAALTIGTGPDTLALLVSEDAWQGNAQFTVSVDGHQIGGTQTATASHAAGQTQTFDVKGIFAAGNHTATVSFLNDAYGGTPTEDRNLYVIGATIDNNVISAATLTELTTGSQSFNFLALGGSGSADSVTVDQPPTLHSGLQAITGTESDPSQSIFLDWNTSHIPALSDSGWVQAKVGSSGALSDSVTIDPAGTIGALFYRIGSGPTLAAWSGIPS
jgi:hypothetical protein